MRKWYLAKNFVFFIILSSIISTDLKAQVSVVTQHNNIKRTGWVRTETVLNQKNVNKNSFGKIFTRQVDDQIYTQPLVVSNLTINGKTRNVVFTTTVNNSVYGFDA